MIHNEPELVGTLRKVVAVFDMVKIDYALCGSFAGSVYGEACATRDVDIIAAVAGRHAGLLAAALGSEFYADEPQISAAVMNESSFNLIHLPAMAKVDVHVVCRSDFGRTQLARRQCKQVSRTEPLDIFVTSAEDTILAKLVADRQPREVVGAIKMQAGALDRAYLRDWAGRLNLTDLLRRAIDDAGLPPDS